MASGAKKRRSRSLSQKTASKRVRHPSSSPSHSAPPKKQIPKTKTSHLKSVSHENQDSYLPRSEEHATSLPTVDDWVFRAKVSSSSTDLTNNIFMKAVQGLVKICFPDGVLEQLGIQLVEQHMHEKNAPGKNNCKMVRIFRAEMAHRVTWMLAEYMDALTKLEAGEEATVAASASLHGFKLGYDILGHVVTSSGHRRDRVPSGSTRRLSEGATLQRSTTPDLSVQREELVNLTSDAFESEQFAVEEGPPPPSPLERTEQNGLIERHPKREEAPDEKAMDAVYPTVPIRAARDNKVSRTWAWDVIPEKAAPASFYGCLLSMADFFAYHALPLARKKLGTHAKRKQLRRAIESMLQNTLDTDLEKWVECYKRLLDGDSEMLIHGEHDTLHGGRTTTIATPAPIDVRRHSKDSAKGKHYAENVSTLIEPSSNY